MEKTFSYDSATGLGPIWAKEYALESPRAVLVICHGMLEHFGRYDAFANRMRQNGFAVFGFDLAGHGKSTPDHPRGYFGKNGYWKLVDDLHTLRQKAQAEYPGVPILLMGHSMGSLIARAYCEKYGKGLSGTIWMGNSGVRLMLPIAGLLLTSFAPRRKPSMFFRKVTFSDFYKTYEKPCDVFAWISSNPGIVEEYKADKLRIETFTGKGYYDLGALTLHVSKSAWFKSLPKDLPILMTSGVDDPVGQYGEGVKQIQQKLSEQGVKDITVRLYPKARHEILNDACREQVFSDLLDWANTHAAR